MAKTDEYQVMQQTEAFRLFDPEYSKVCKVVKKIKDIDGERKYKDRSHFYRVAIMKLLKEELKKLEVKPGRPEQ